MAILACQSLPGYRKHTGRAVRESLTYHEFKIRSTGARGTPTAVVRWPSRRRVVGPRRSCAFARLPCCPFARTAPAGRTVRRQRVAGGTRVAGRPLSGQLAGTWHDSRLRRDTRTPGLLHGTIGSIEQQTRGRVREHGEDVPVIP